MNLTEERDLPDQPDDSPQPEGEHLERPFRSDASRSRDGDHARPESESFEEEYEWEDDPSLDDAPHDPEFYEEQVRRAQSTCAVRHVYPPPGHSGK